MELESDTLIADDKFVSCRLGGGGERGGMKNWAGILAELTVRWLIRCGVGTGTWDVTDGRTRAELFFYGQRKERPSR